MYHWRRVDEYVSLCPLRLLESSRSRWWQLQWQVKVSFWFLGSAFALCPHVVRGSKRLAWTSFIWTLVSIYEGSTSPKPPHRGRILIYEFCREEDKHSDLSKVLPEGTTFSQTQSSPLLGSSIPGPPHQGFALPSVPTSPLSLWDRDRESFPQKQQYNSTDYIWTQKPPLKVYSSTKGTEISESWIQIQIENPWDFSKLKLENLYIIFHDGRSAQTLSSVPNTEREEGRTLWKRRNRKDQTSLEIYTTRRPVPPTAPRLESRE
jgi:hypothetical protein